MAEELKGSSPTAGSRRKRTLPPSRRVTNLLAGWPISWACSAEQEQGFEPAASPLAGRGRTALALIAGSVNVSPQPHQGSCLNRPLRRSHRHVSPVARVRRALAQASSSRRPQCRRCSLLSRWRARMSLKPQGDRPSATQELTLCGRDFRIAGNPTIFTDREAPCDSFV